MTVTRTIAAIHRGPRLFAWRVGPAAGRADRSILLVHGAGEHSQRYLRIARRLARDGWDVVGFDLRGHGCSDGVPVHVRSFRDYVEDLERVARHFDLQPARTAVLAHSLGGLIAISASQTDVFRPAAMALSAPLLELAADVPLWKLLAGRSMKRAWPTTRFRTSVEPTHLLHDAAARDARQSDPLICRSLTAGFFFNATGASRKAWHRPAPGPMLLLQGDADRVVAPDAARRWHERNPQTCELRMLPGSVHELFHEPDGADLATDAAAWLGQRLEAGPTVRLRDAA